MLNCRPDRAPLPTQQHSAKHSHLRRYIAALCSDVCDEQAFAPDVRWYLDQLILWQNLTLIILLGKIKWLALIAFSFFFEYFVTAAKWALTYKTHRFSLLFHFLYFFQFFLKISLLILRPVYIIKVQIRMIRKLRSLSSRFLMSWKFVKGILTKTVGTVKLWAFFHFFAKWLLWT